MLRDSKAPYERIENSEKEGRSQERCSINRIVPTFSISLTASLNLQILSSYTACTASNTSKCRSYTSPRILCSGSFTNLLVMASRMASGASRQEIVVLPLPTSCPVVAAAAAAALLLLLPSGWSNSCLVWNNISFQRYLPRPGRTCLTKKMNHVAKHRLTSVRVCTRSMNQGVFDARKNN